MSADETKLDSCGCCEGAEPLTPQTLAQPPGRSALTYRAGTHGSFKATMLTALPRQPQLRTLGTRSDDDPAIALIDAWAAALDVLTFYQERIANEGFLRTATERRSVLELARSIGYELGPGVAAGTYLAYTLETAEGSPEEVRIDAGSKAQSIPGQDESPQLFETAEELTARGAWNALLPRTREPWTPAIGQTVIYLEGTATDLKTGDTLVIFGDERVGDSESTQWDFRRVAAVNTVFGGSTEASYTEVTLETPLGSSDPAREPAKNNIRVYALRQRASLFGYNALNWQTLPDETKASYLGYDDVETYRDHYDDDGQWPQYSIYAPAAGQSVLPLNIDVPVEPTVENVVKAAVDAADTYARTAGKRAEQSVPQAANAAATAATASANAVRDLIAAVVEQGLATAAGIDRAAMQSQYAAAVGPVLDSFKTLLEKFTPPIQDFTGNFDVIKGLWDLGVPPDLNRPPAAVQEIIRTLVSNFRIGFRNASEATEWLTALQTNVTGLVNVVLSSNPLNLPADILRSLDLGAADVAGTIRNKFETVREEADRALGAAKNAASSFARNLAAQEGAVLVKMVATVAKDTPVLPAGKTRVEFVAEALTGTTELVRTAVSTQAPVLAIPLLAANAATAPIGLALLAAHVMLGPDASAAAEEFEAVVNEAVETALHPTASTSRRRDLTLTQNTIDLDSLYPKVVKGGWVVLSMPGHQELREIVDVVEAARSDFLLTAKTTRITLDAENLAAFESALREIVVYAVSEELPVAQQPIVSAVSGDEIPLSEVVEDLSEGRLLAVVGLDADTGEERAEIAELRSASESDDVTVLTLAEPLTHRYARDSVVINANVARATHGETKTEVLGSGEGSQAFQSFALKQKPLTYVSAATASGGETTLQVRVDGVLWTEVPSFYGIGPEEKVYTTRLADDGTVTVMFGDGVVGARLPTGTENVTATYRVGLGLEGNVNADQVTLLMTRPIGSREVTNPVAASGGDDPEEFADAQTNAPITVLTLDRVVSLQDYEDFARGFAGIGKASAVPIWDGEREIVHLTVAAADGSPVDASSDFYANLLDAIDAARHVERPIVVEPYVARPFAVSARLKVDASYLAEDVLAAASAALQEAFAFEVRNFGQAVTASDILARLQDIEGVVAVDLDTLHFTAATAAWHERLPARVAYRDETGVHAAELLTLAEEDIALSELTP